MLNTQRGAADPITIILAAGALLAMLVGAYRYVINPPSPQPQEQAEDQNIGSVRNE